jgi:hypothetical protein
MTKWGPWEECKWPGIRYRYRQVHSDPERGGAPCPSCLKESDHCTIQDNENEPGVCEVGPCLLEIQAEYDAKLQGAA